MLWNIVNVMILFLLRVGRVNTRDLRTMSYNGFGFVIKMFCMFCFLLMLLMCVNCVFVREFLSWFVVFMLVIFKLEFLTSTLTRENCNLFFSSGLFCFLYVVLVGIMKFLYKSNVLLLCIVVSKGCLCVFWNELMWILIILGILDLALMGVCGFNTRMFLDSLLVY